MPTRESQFANDKKEIEQEARKLEKERDINRSKDPYFEYAEVLLQIAIVMASVSIISASRAVFGFSVLVASLGALMCANGYLQIFAAALSALSICWPCRRTAIRSHFAFFYLPRIDKLWFFKDYAGVRRNGFCKPDITADYRSGSDNGISAKDRCS